MSSTESPNDLLDRLESYLGSDYNSTSLPTRASDDLRALIPMVRAMSATFRMWMIREDESFRKRALELKAHFDAEKQMLQNAMEDLADDYERKLALERERCAKLAEDPSSLPGAEYWVVGQVHEDEVGFVIADAIWGKVKS